MNRLPVFTHAPIDIHSHFNHGSPYDCPTNDGGIPDSIHDRSISFVKAAYDHIGIEQAGMSTFASVMEHTECIVTENQFLYDLAGHEKWIYPWIVIDPRQPQTLAQAQAMLGCKKVLGIKIHPSYHGYDILEYGDCIFSFAAEHHTFVLMHPQHIEAMPAYADRYPEMKLIIAHLGGLAHVEAIGKAKYGNIYTDTSGGASNLNNIVEYAVSQVGAEKILFGTDTYSCAFQFGRIALSRLTDTEKAKILYENALRLFPDAFSMNGM